MEEVDTSPGPSSEVLLGMNRRRSYAVAPCHHLFHTKCLAQWLAIKVSPFTASMERKLMKRRYAHCVSGVYLLCSILPASPLSNKRVIHLSLSHVVLKYSQSMSPTSLYQYYTCISAFDLIRPNSNPEQMMVPKTDILQRSPPTSFRSLLSRFCLFLRPT